MHIFISDFLELDRIKLTFRQQGCYLKDSQVDHRLPGIFFVQKEKNEIILEEVDPILINECIRAYENTWI